MHRLILALAFILFTSSAWASCPGTVTDCPSPTYDNLTVGGTLTAPVATSSVAGIVKPDNSTITVTGGVLTAVGGGGGGGPYTNLTVTNQLDLSAISGSTQCLQVNSSGIVSGTGLTCAGATSLPTPSISTGFGSSPTPPSGQTIAYATITVGGGGIASTGVVLFSVTQPHGYSCHPSDDTNSASYNTVSTYLSANTVTFTNYSRTTGLVTPWTAGDIIRFDCSAG